MAMPRHCAGVYSDAGCHGVVLDAPRKTACIISPTKSAAQKPQVHFAALSASKDLRYKIPPYPPL
jgi:hypothetical protein